MFVSCRAYPAKYTLLYLQLKMSSNENENVPLKVSKSKFVVRKHNSIPRNASSSSSSSAGGSATALTTSRHSIDTVSSKVTIASTQELPRISTCSSRDTQDPKGFLEKRGYHVTKELGSGGFAT